MLNMSSLTGRVVIVTDASKGIGSGIPEALAAADARSADKAGAERVVQRIIDYVKLTRNSVTSGCHMIHDQSAQTTLRVDKPVNLERRTLCAF
jgi:NAD(P)-dependent dehydrogenase (short-subunit alcohol dehydrogenase family)